MDAVRYTPHVIVESYHFGLEFVFQLRDSPNEFEVLLSHARWRVSCVQKKPFIVEVVLVGFQMLHQVEYVDMACFDAFVQCLVPSFNMICRSCAEFPANIRPSDDWLSSSDLGEEIMSYRDIQ